MSMCRHEHRVKVFQERSSMARRGPEPDFDRGKLHLTARFEGSRSLNTFNEKNNELTITPSMSELLNRFGFQEQPGSLVV